MTLEKLFKINFFKTSPKSIFLGIILLLSIYIIFSITYQITERCTGIDSGNDGYQAYQHAHEKKPGIDVIAFCQPSRFLPRCGDFSSNSRLMFCRPVISRTQPDLAMIAGLFPKKDHYFSRPSYSADYSDDKILVGASHNVFIGKVLKQIGNKEMGIGPETQFEVDVVFNIKGDLSQKVIVNQQGGMKGDVLYGTGEVGMIYPGNDISYLLVPGSTYVLATRYNRQENWYTLNSHPNARKLLNKDPNTPMVELISQSEKDESVTALIEAYEQEVLLDVDVANNNARNSYQSLNPEASPSKTTRDLAE